MWINSSVVVAGSMECVVLTNTEEKYISQLTTDNSSMDGCNKYRNNLELCIYLDDTKHSIYTTTVRMVTTHIHSLIHQGWVTPSWLGDSMEQFTQHKYRAATTKQTMLGEVGRAMCSLLLRPVRLLTALPICATFLYHFNTKCHGDNLPSTYLVEPDHLYVESGHSLACDVHVC